MQELTVIGVEDGGLLAAGDDGARYRIAIDDVVATRLKARRPERAGTVRVAPRDIQARIRAGRSVEDVARETGATLEQVERFTGPVIAEREHIVSSALGVTVRTSQAVDPLGEPATFGVVIRDRLASLGAEGERWSAWKDEEEGWIVRLSFTADSIDHEARWSFDAKKRALAPQGPEAVTLSAQSEPTGGLIPRLRAVGSSGIPDDSRFDSGAFAFDAGEAAPETALIERVPSAPNPVSFDAINRERERPSGQTADLLEALRRRRGEREAARPAPAPEDETLDIPGDEPAPRRADTGPVAARARKGRAAMPSWDEIVFGARSDDDPA